MTSGAWCCAVESCISTCWKRAAKATSGTWPSFRIEQLYPFPHDLCEELFKRYADVEDIVWAQEEPKNQGAWYRVRARLERWLVKGQRLRYMGRAGAASPAPGSMQLHRLQQYAIVEQVLDRDRKLAV